jgi:hypothetical protein
VYKTIDADPPLNPLKNTNDEQNQTEWTGLPYGACHLYIRLEVLRKICEKHTRKPDSSRVSNWVPPGLESKAFCLCTYTYGSSQQHSARTGTHIASSHLPFVIYGERLDLKTVIVLISVMKIKDAEVESYCNKNIWNACCCCVSAKQNMRLALVFRPLTPWCWTWICLYCWNICINFYIFFLLLYLATLSVSRRYSFGW